MLEQVFDKILVIAPSSERKGGIATVIKMYKAYINADYFVSTRYQISIRFYFFIKRILILIKRLVLNKKIKSGNIHGHSKGSFY